MVYITGDIHGDLDRFKQKAAKKLKKNDYLIVCGDFGFIWDNSKKEKQILKWLGKRRYKILFVEGAHDNLRLLGEYPAVDYCGGKARQISGNLYQLIRGYVFNIDSLNIFAFGGRESSDSDVRELGVTWFEDELPTQAELELARQNLERCRGVVDYIVTHESTANIKSFLDMQNKTNARIHHLNAFFEDVAKNCRFKKWYFGAYHADKIIPPCYHAVFKDIVPINK